ncbi:MAG: Gfo/Idh/MocA family oxidoreductase [Pirellulales bacterium]|nr:Gfo/Idh/MocA family oxidoreductase [Pirellulales bacterium]
MSRQPTRRQFISTTTATGIGFWLAGGAEAKESKSPNERIRMASIGIGGKGSSDSNDAGKHGDMVAICDADRTRLGLTHKKRFPKAKTFTDFRKMLDEMGKSIDAVTVSTPDHTHAPAALMAMRMGKHCFCQKPLTHSIYEARLMGKVAAETGVATMMGNQGTAASGLREAAAILRSGALGTVKEVHVWTNRPIWPQNGKGRPQPAPCPKTLDWQSWLGPAAEQPFANGYHPFAWRGWWDFGTGALGDMACHNVNMPFAGLDLRNPTSVIAKTSGHEKVSFPKWSTIEFEFPANDKRAGLKLFWYDGGKLPAEELMSGVLKEGEKIDLNASLTITDKAKLYMIGNDNLRVSGMDKPKVEFEKSPGHFEEWVRAIKGGKPAMSNFKDYAGPLTETILLGNLAVWVDGKKVEWDAQNMKVKNISGLETLVKPVYRKGYTLDV